MAEWKVLGIKGQGGMRGRHILAEQGWDGGIEKKGRVEWVKIQSGKKVKAGL